MKFRVLFASFFLTCCSALPPTPQVQLESSPPAPTSDFCQGFGPQTPRDISNLSGSNPQIFTMAPAADRLNLCNIHFHTQAEHKGPGFSIFAGTDEHGGYRCNETPDLTPSQLAELSHGHGACHGVKPGETLEVHWVYTSCDVTPGEGLGSCLSESCANPQLRVESQVFLVVNDASATNFADFTYTAPMANGLHQPKALPTNTGKPITFAGSTTGSSYTEQKCSPYQVTWSVRPTCTKVHASSLHKWCEGNVFQEDHAHGVRQIVTRQELLAPFQ